MRSLLLTVLLWPVAALAVLHHGYQVRAKWTGPTREVRNPDGDVVGEEPASYAQYRDADGIVHNLPAGDLDDHAWDGLPAEARAAARDSGLYDVLTDAEAAARQKRATERGQAAAPAADAKE